MRIRILSHGGKFRVCLLGVLFVLGDSSHAVTETAKENPYAKAIMGRNVFSLNAGRPPTLDPPRPPPPHITLQGVTGRAILGRRQVLFKVQKSGAPAREMSCVLSEGERWGEIEVLVIDEIAGTAKFNNHGTVQTLNLKNDLPQ